MTCVHHWLIGDNLRGVCQHCGAVRQFPRNPALSKHIDYGRAVRLPREKEGDGC